MEDHGQRAVAARPDDHGGRERHHEPEQRDSEGVVECHDSEERRYERPSGAKFRGDGDGGGRRRGGGDGAQEQRHREWCSEDPESHGHCGERRHQLDRRDYQDVAAGLSELRDAELGPDGDGDESQRDVGDRRERLHDVVGNHVEDRWAEQKPGDYVA